MNAKEWLFNSRNAWIFILKGERQAHERCTRCFSTYWFICMGIAKQNHPRTYHFVFRDIFMGAAMEILIYYLRLSVTWNFFHSRSSWRLWMRPKRNQNRSLIVYLWYFPKSQEANPWVSVVEESPEKPIKPGWPALQPSRHIRMPTEYYSSGREWHLSSSC